MSSSSPTPAPGSSNTRTIIFVSLMIVVVVAVAYILIVGKHTAPPPPPATSGGMQQGPEQFRKDAIMKITTPAGTVKQELEIEIVDREETRMQGMMGRTSMAQNRGMLFIFDNDEPRSFWMANTPLPLDIIFITRDREIIRIHSRTTPYSEQNYESGRDCRYVLETNAGYCDRHGIREGDKVTWSR